jgi:transglutaminase-like putative cysteine protease
VNGRLRLAFACGIATLLGSAALAPLFDTWAWLGYAVLTVVTVTGVSLVARRLSVPDGLVPLLNLGALALLVTMLFGNGTELFGVFPSSGTLGALRRLLSAASTDIVQLAVPVPPRRGLLLLTVLGVGAVAVVVDALAVSLRRPSLTGLPLLAMFAVPVAVARDGIGWLPFAVSATGYLILLLSEGSDRITRWGRPFTEHSTGGDGWRPDPLEGSPIGAAGRRIGAVAIGIAVVVPAIIPFVHAGGLAGFATGGGGAGPGSGGGGSAGELEPIAQLRGQLVRLKPIEVLQVRTNDPEPFYLRLTTLDTFTGAGWKQGRPNTAQAKPVSGGLPSPGIAQNVPRIRFNTTVQVRGLTTSQFLPVYAIPTKISAKGDWRYDQRTGSVFARRTSTRDLTYAFQSVTPNRYNPRLLALFKQAPDANAEMQARYGRGNILDDPKIQVRVNTIIGSRTTPYEKTLALYNYFRDGTQGFRYSTSTGPGNGTNALEAFLDNKVGYCEQYASAMAAMARYAGLPARVAIGYTTGQRKGDHWSVTTNDAHAWVEIYFSNVGWVPWDPTPLGTGGHATTLPYAAPAAAAGGTAGGEDTKLLPGVTNKLRQLEAREQREGRSDLPLPLPKPIQAPDHTAQWLLAISLAVVVTLVPSICRIAVRRSRLRRMSGDDPRLAAHAAWDEVLATAHDLGHTLDEAQTPRRAAARLAGDSGLDEPAAAALHDLAIAEEQARYSPRPPATEALADVVHRLRRAMLTRASRRAALRARLFPPSAIRGAGQRGGPGIADVLERFDAALARRRRAVLNRLAPSRPG